VIGPIARARRALYVKGVIRPDALPRPVVSVGNLTVGGSGKTPHVQFLARWMVGLDLRPAVLSRGYGRRGRGVVWVSDGERVLAGPDEAGDEPVLLARTLPGVPVLVGESRLEAGRACLRRLEADVFLLDDGFQHLPIFRNADILLVDADRGLGNRRTLPLGPLREPPASARFADILVVTKCPGVPEGEKVAATVPFPPERPRAFSRLIPRALVDRDGVAEPLPPGGAGVTAFSGLARNGQFRATLAEAGFRITRFLSFRDHYRYAPADIGRIAEAAEGGMVVTTEKDLVRLPPELPFAVRALRVEVVFLSGWEDVAGLLLQILDRARAR
jgi:tetraacyldisaccharide 4'-kinase